jgi:hypothetical protein
MSTWRVSMAVNGNETGTTRRSRSVRCIGMEMTQDVSRGSLGATIQMSTGAVIIVMESCVDLQGSSVGSREDLLK